MNADLNRIGMAVTEAQAVLELVAEKMTTDKPLEADTAFTLLAAVTAAISRLDAVHDALQETVKPETITIVTGVPQ